MALEQSLQDEDLQTPTGVLFRSVSDLDFALRAGIPITLDEITREEFLGLQALHAVRDQYQQEEMERGSGSSSSSSSLPTGQGWHKIDR